MYCALTNSTVYKIHPSNIYQQEHTESTINLDCRIMHHFPCFHSFILTFILLQPMSQLTKQHLSYHIYVSISACQFNSTQLSFIFLFVAKTKSDKNSYYFSTFSEQETKMTGQHFFFTFPPKNLIIQYVDVNCD